jgi:maleylacetoacetate isomerase/maleylpyruvate isomerase
MTDQATLYGFWRSMAAYRVRVALHLKGVQVQETTVDLDAGEQLSPQFLAVNPEGALPALVEPGQPALTQSMAILEYLNERYPQPPLLPKDLHARARVRSLAALIASDTHPLIVPRVRSYLSSHAGFDHAAWRAWATHWVTRGANAMEKRLAGDPATGGFCHGDQVSFADICLASLIIVARAIKFELKEIPTITRIVGRCEEMEAFQRANPLQQPGAPV